MKKAILILVLSSMAIVAGAQQKVAMSDKGWWVIENNVHARKQCVVKFYDNASKLVYQETITGKKLRINNDRTRAALNDVLQKALQGKVGTEPVLAMTLFK